MDIHSFFTSSNKLFYVLIASVVIFVFITVVFILRSLSGTSSENIVLQVWGVFDSKEEFAQLTKAYERIHPRVRIEYTGFSFEDYERKVVDAFASGNGPDIWMVHNTWLPKHKSKMMLMPTPAKPVPALINNLKDFQTAFVEAPYYDLVSGGKIYSLPVYVDTLAMYFNRDILNTAGITKPPTTWSDFNGAVEEITKFDERGNITQAGAAVGSSRNINRSTDILMNMMVQSGVQMTDASHREALFAHPVNSSPVGQIALQYYTDFTNPAKKTYTWNENQHYSIDAFSEGTVGMMFNYSHQIDLLRSKSPRLNFGVAPIPQASLDDARTFASYWAPAVAANTKNDVAAWDFMQYWASADGARVYLNATKRPSARRDLVELQKTDPDLGVFALQALTAKSWFQVDEQSVERIFADMIDDVNLGHLTVSDAIQNGESKVNVLLRTQ